MSCSGCSNGRASSRSASPACAARTTSTRSRQNASPGSQAMSTPSAGSGPTSGGTPPSWYPGRTALGLASAVISPHTPQPPACTRSASTTSSAARTTASLATRYLSRATPRPASTRGHSSKDGFPRASSTGSARNCPRQGAAFPPTRTRGSCRTSGNSRPSRWAWARSTPSTRPGSTGTCWPDSSRTPAGREYGRSSATGRPTSPRCSARSAWPPGRSSTTSFS